MTTQQRDQLELAIDRATREGVEIVGHGRRRSDGARLWCVPSTRESSRWHIVVLEGRRLRCDCEGSRHGRICKHAACVHMVLVVEADRRAALADEVAAAMCEEREEREEQALLDATARLEQAHQALDRQASAYSRESPRLADDRAPVTCWK